MTEHKKENPINNIDTNKIKKDAEGLFGDFLNIIKLDEKTIEKVSKDKNATQYAYSVLAGVGLLNALYMSFIGIKIPFAGHFTMPFTYSILSAVINIIVFVAFMYIFNLVAEKMFHKKEDPNRLIRVTGLVYILNLAYMSKITLLGLVAAIFGLIIFFKSVKIIYKLDIGSTIINIIISGIAVAIISFMLHAILPMNSLFYESNFKEKNFKGLNIDVPGDDGGSLNLGKDGIKIKGNDGESLEFNFNN